MVSEVISRVDMVVEIQERVKQRLLSKGEAAGDSEF